MHEEVRETGGGMLHVTKEQGTHISQPILFSSKFIFTTYRREEKVDLDVCLATHEICFYKYREILT